MVTVGETVIIAPFPSDVPLQEPEYHCQVAPVPKLPPKTPSVVPEPMQISFPDAELGAVEG